MTDTGKSTVEEQARIALEGHLTAHTAAPVWRSALETLERHSHRAVIVDASRLEYADDVGIALLFDLIRRERPPGAKVEIRDLASNLAALVEHYDPKDFLTSPRVPSAAGVLEHVGRASARQASYLGQMASFLRQCATELRHAFRRRGGISWGEVWDVATEAGANGLPVVLLIGFLIGVIIAFQSALVAAQYGAVIFVVDGVAFAVLRELGPLMTAIVFAGRTGAAFAAQIGMQKVNEEVNAITTFGLSPIHFLVLPRLIAALLVMPLLVAFADVIGLFGGALVMTHFDVSFLQFYNRVLSAVTAWDFTLGLIKGTVFGLVIAAVGCQRGLTTGAGATSVGLSATSAVVTSIVLIIVIDGIFALFSM